MADTGKKANPPQIPPKKPSISQKVLLYPDKSPGNLDKKADSLTQSTEGIAANSKNKEKNGESLEVELDEIVNTMMHSFDKYDVSRTANNGNEDLEGAMKGENSISKQMETTNPSVQEKFSPVPKPRPMPRPSVHKPVATPRSRKISPGTASDLSKEGISKSTEEIHKEVEKTNEHTPEDQAKDLMADLKRALSLSLPTAQAQRGHRRSNTEPVEIKYEGDTSKTDIQVTTDMVDALAVSCEDDERPRTLIPDSLEPVDNITENVQSLHPPESRVSNRTESRFGSEAPTPTNPQSSGFPSLNIPDPVTLNADYTNDSHIYECLWNLKAQTEATQSKERIDTSNKGDVPSANLTSREGPAIPPRAWELAEQPLLFSFPSVEKDGASDISGDQLMYRQLSSFGTRQWPSFDEFRSSYLNPLLEDPFAESDDLFSLDSQCISLPILSSDSVDTSKTTQKLISKRTPPRNTSVGYGEQGSIADLYSKINKNQQQQVEQHYYLAAGADFPDLSGYDNHAVSYESEDTLEEDSGSEPENTSLSGSRVNLNPLPSPSPKASLTMRNGHLFKQGGKQSNKGWRKRYVTFDGQKLKYYSNEKKRISKKIIPVEVIRSIENDVKDSDSGKYKFRVITINRVFTFAAETLEENHFWTQILMSAVIQHNKQYRGSMGKGFIRGGDMHSPDKEGYLKINDHKKYVAIKGGILCYYQNEEDFDVASPIHEVSLMTTSVKDLNRQKLTLTTPYCQYSLTFESELELDSWKIAIEDGIAAALSDDKVLNEFYQNSSNMRCADCACSKPHWAVLHLVIVVCSQCAGIHRHFWPHKVKSIRMDTKVWTSSIITLFKTYGNQTANEIWEFSKSSTDKISSACNPAQRKLFLLKKYLQKKYFQSPAVYENFSSSLELNKSGTQIDFTDCIKQRLLEAIKSADIKQVMRFINLGADALCLDSNLLSALELAEKLTDGCIAEYLKQNGADNETYADIWSVIKSEQVIDGKTVTKSGYLHRMHNLKKGAEYPRMWAVLYSDRTLQMYDQEQDTDPKLSIPCASIINISIHHDDKGDPSFELFCNQGGKLYIFGLAQWDLVYDWMKAIILAIRPNSELPSLELDYTKAGCAYSKLGSLGAWKWCWLWIKKKQFCISSIDNSWEEKIDLRKALKISFVENDSSIEQSPAEESSHPIVLFLPNRYIYIQSDVKSETESWYKVIDSACKELSNVHSLEDQPLSKDNVPILIEKCLDFIFLNGMSSEGIYRLSGSHSKVANLLNELISGARSVYIKLEEYTVHDVANVLKRYLRTLQSPLMTCSKAGGNLYGEWLASTITGNHQNKLLKYKDLLNRLPDVHYSTLKALIGHLARVAEYEGENKMSKVNLATVFGPVLLSGSGGSGDNYTNTSSEIQAAIDLMSYYKWLFSVDDSEFNKERKMQEKIAQIQNASSTVAPREFILGIYVDNFLSDPMNVKVSETMTGYDVISEVARSKRIPRIDGYGLFHVVCGGDLECQVKENELVLDVTLAVADWDSEHKKDSHLCVKEDYITYNIEHVAGSDVPKFTELQFCNVDKKTWKKMYFELTISQLICHKEKAESRVAEWCLDDIMIYIGVERKRKPPTVHGITFLLRTDDFSDKSQFIGRSICFNSQQEMFTWLAFISNAQSLGPVDTSFSSNRTQLLSQSATSLLEKKGNIPKKGRASIRNMLKKLP